MTAGTPQHHLGSNGLRTVDPRVVAYMRSTVRCQTDEVLNEQFGVSYNTWRKIIAGLPVRTSLANRLENRIFQRVDV
jgi:hypothetical protein